MRCQAAFLIVDVSHSVHNFSISLSRQRAVKSTILVEVSKMLCLTQNDPIAVQ